MQPAEPTDDDEWEDIDDDDDDDDDDYDFRKDAIEHLSGDQGKAVLAEYPGAPCKMVLVVRKDVKMGKGKTAAQCCHAAVACYKIARRFQKKLVHVWEDMGQSDNSATPFPPKICSWTLVGCVVLRPPFRTGGNEANPLVRRGDEATQQ